MSVNFCFLARYALACPTCDVSGHKGPNETCGNERDVTLMPGMAQRMNVVGNLMLELNEDEWGKSLPGDIA